MGITDGYGPRGGSGRSGYTPGSSYGDGGSRSTPPGSGSSSTDFPTAPREEEDEPDLPSVIGSVDDGINFRVGGAYRDGDEWSVSNWGVGRLADLQYSLVVAGFLDAEDIGRDGYWDAASADALKDLMEIGNGRRRSWQEVLGGILQSPDGANRSRSGGRRGGGGGGGRAPLQIRLSNPEDLKTAFRQAAQQSTGGVFVDESQINSMVATYQEKEAEFQRQAYAGASNLTDPPSAGTFAEGQIEATDEAGVEASRFADMTRVLLQLTGGE